MPIPAKAAPTKVNVATPVVLYGIGEDDKPQAALFASRLCDLAIKAAGQLKLNVLKVTTDEVAQIAAKLPSGRINSTGRGLVGNVRKPLYDQLLTAAGIAHGPSAQKADAKGTSAPLNEAHSSGNAAGSAGPPKSWKDIGPGGLVLVQESLNDGWWEAVVVERKGDMLTVRWRDYAKWKPFTIHADAVALLNASPAFKAA